MIRRFAGLIALAALAFLTRPVWAAISYQYVTDKTSYSAQPGASVTVQVYLLETLTGGSTSLINNHHGVSTAGVGVQQAGTVPANAAIISSISTNQSAVGAGGGFGTNAADQSNVKADGSNVALQESVAGGSTGPTTDVNGKILLGTMTLTAGAANTITTFSVTSFANSSNSLATGFGGPSTATKSPQFDLDRDNNGGGGPPATYNGANDISNTFTVVAVPEPSSIMLCALAVCSGAFVAFQGRKARLWGWERHPIPCLHVASISQTPTKPIACSRR
jgi:hypothetical protein